MEFRKNATYVIFLSAGLIVLGLFAWRVADILLLAFAGGVVAVLIRACADALHRALRLPEGVALAVSVLGLAGLLAVGGWLLLPPFADQLAQLVMRLPELVGQLEAQLSNYAWAQDLLSGLPTLADLAGRAGDVLNQVTSTLSGTLSALANVLFVLVLGIFLAAEPGVYKKRVLRLLPAPQQDRASELASAVVKTLRAWLLGELVAMFFVGLLTYLAMLLIGVPLPLALGVLAGLLDFIPLFGPIFAAVPALLLALSGGFTQVLWVLVAYVVIQQIEGNLLQPLVQERAVSIPPALLLLSLVIMGQLFGLLGLLVATPLTAVGLVVVAQLYKNRLGSDRPESAAPPLKSVRSRRSEGG